MTFSHSFHSLEAEKGPISFTFGHTHTDMVDTKSPPRELTALRRRLDIRLRLFQILGLNLFYLPFLDYQPIRKYLISHDIFIDETTELIDVSILHSLN